MSRSDGVWSKDRARKAADDELKKGSIWKGTALVLTLSCVVLVGVVFVTLPQSMSYSALLDENLDLKQQVKEIEGELAEVDHILVKLRLYDAQLKMMANQSDAFKETEPDK